MDPVGEGNETGVPVVVPALRPRNGAIGYRIKNLPKGTGIQKKMGEKKVAMYADNVLLFLGDTQSSLRAAMGIVKYFGYFSGLVINWEKSVLLPIDPLIEPLSQQVTQIRVSQMRYLDINITRDPGQYITGNVVPLMTKLKQKYRVWSCLPLSVAGFR